MEVVTRLPGLLPLPGERDLNLLVRKAKRDALLLQIRSQGPRLVYAGLLWHALYLGHKPGWASYCFKEIFGTWPRPKDKCKAVRWANDDLELWIATRKRQQASSPTRKGSVSGSF